MHSVSILDFFFVSLLTFLAVIAFQLTALHFQGMRLPAVEYLEKLAGLHLGQLESLTVSFGHEQDHNNTADYYVALLTALGKVLMKLKHLTMLEFKEPPFVNRFQNDIFCHRPEWNVQKLRILRLDSYTIPLLPHICAPLLESISISSHRQVYGNLSLFCYLVHI